MCAHSAAEAINKALVAGEPYRSVANRYESLSQAAVQRHKDKHLPATLVMAEKAHEVAHADDLLADVRGLQARTLTILEATEAASEHRTALAAIKEARSNLELLAKLLGELSDAPQVNILISPVVQQTIVAALEPFPQARLAVSDALNELEQAEMS